jgi:sec-independent protein translocase protein TatC
MWPWEQAVGQYLAANPEAKAELIQDLVSPFMLALKTSLVTGLIAASPVWLYQLWSFIVRSARPGEEVRHPVRRRGHSPLPLGVRSASSCCRRVRPCCSSWAACSTCRTSTTSCLELTLIVLFGVSFLLPVVLVMLNLIGVVTGAQLSSARTYAIFGCFLFGAMATPSADPFSMTALAAPMAVMYVVAEVICRRADKAKKKRLSSNEFAVSLDS